MKPNLLVSKLIGWRPKFRLSTHPSPGSLVPVAGDNVEIVESFTRIIRTTRLKFFGHTARSDPPTDHTRALRACTWPLHHGTGTADRADRAIPAPDHWIRLSTIQHWSDNRLLSSTESTILEHARGNGNVRHWTWTSHTMMMMMMMMMKTSSCAGVDTVEEALQL